MTTNVTDLPDSRPGIRQEARPTSHVVVLFGSTGDLAKRKLLPGLFHLYEAGLLPESFRIVGTSRKPISDEEFRGRARAAIDEFGRTTRSDDAWEAFAGSLSYAPSDAGDAGALAEAVSRAEDQLGEGDVRRLHYLSVPPKAMAGIVSALGDSGLADGASVIMEKPFGTDLESARALNAAVHQVFDESQIFRIDHFLGKESVQNILALRFANGMFEPVWNGNHIDHVQIDVPETLSIGSRAGFYEGTGAFRDMIVTHLFQVLGFVAMEPPTSLDASALVQEKVKVFEAMRPIDPARVVRGQYEGYLEEQGVEPDSQTETLRRARDRDRERTLGRGPVLHAYRQAAPAGPAGDHDRLPGAGDADVPGRERPRPERARVRGRGARARSRPASSRRSRAPHSIWARPGWTSATRSPSARGTSSRRTSA